MTSESKNKTWLAVDVVVRPQGADAVEFALGELDTLGTEIDILGKPAAQEFLMVVGYFHQRIESKLLRERLDDALAIYGLEPESIGGVNWREVENKDWLEEWKKHWKPTESEKFIVAPAWFNLDGTEKMVIRIEPSMAFGTGTHETTRLCLSAIERFYRPGMSFLDVGTGTGILAIAASMISNRPGEKNFSGAANILACDTDVDSVTIARENGTINSAPEIEFYVGSIDESTPKFEFVCANLTADVILPMLPLLAAKKSQVLILSGILVEQQDSVVAALRNLGINDFTIERDGEWISIRA
jgi:ribosomal protein L11 methyltransferase